MTDTSQVLTKAREGKIKEIQLQFSDLFGVLKNVAIPINMLPDALERGIWFDGSSIEGFARIMESDMFLKPDLDTYCSVPWEKGVARFICDVYRPDGQPYECDPRYILKKTLREAKEKGYTYNVGPEPEFYFFKAGDNGVHEFHDGASYFDLAPNDLGAHVRRDIVDNLIKMGIEVEASHHEVGPGQQEIAFKYADALTTADRLLVFKQTVKVIAMKHGLRASFIPKFKTKITGSGMHVHESLFDQEGNNIFFDESKPYFLSDMAKHFVAGQLKYIKEIVSVVSPSVNSYKRLVPGYEAPAYICWAQVNRSSLIRVPRIFKDRPKAARVELRCPDSSANPYLAFAVMFKAGLKGIEEKVVTPAPVEEDVFKFTKEDLEKKAIDVLPETLGHAISHMDNGTVVKETLGKEAYQKYLHAKKLEWEQMRMHVSEWEQEKYFNI